MGRGRKGKRKLRHRLILEGQLDLDVEPVLRAAAQLLAGYSSKGGAVGGGCSGKG